VKKFLFFAFSIFALISCDGPNTETAVSSADRGVHNQDGFGVTVKINNGASLTAELNVSVQISATGAKEMYVTQESACNIGGQWEAYNSFKLWTLQKPETINFFYVKVRNDGQESDCAFASISHDSILN
jgi:hypothetical protein